MNIYERLAKEEVAVERLLQAAHSNMGLLVVGTMFHGDGSVYENRYFAIPKGEHRFRGKKLVISDEMDCNADHSFKLPKGSMELCWQPRKKASYSY